MTDTALPPEPSGLRLVMTVAVAGLVSGLALAGVNEIARPRILANRAAALRLAVFDVVPGATSMQKLTADSGAIRVAANDESTDLYGGYGDEGQFVGYAIASEGPGFQDNIKLIFGFDPAKHRVIGMQVLESRETPGLGDKIFKDAGFVGEFSDLAVDPEAVLVMAGGDDVPNGVDAITGATISSKAVVAIVNKGHAEWRPRIDAASGPPPLSPPLPAETTP